MTPDEEQEHYTYLKLKQKQAMAMSSQPQDPSFAEKTMGAAKNAAVDFATDIAGPENLYKKYGESLPTRGAIMGGSMGGVPGAAMGGGLGQIAKNMMGLATGDPNAPKTPVAAALPAMGQALGAGVMEEPKMLNAVPGVPKVAGMVSNLASKTLRGLAKLGQTASGVKADTLTQAAKQGISTYGAESMPKAQAIFADALGPQGRKAMEQPAKEAFDPVLSKARSVATGIGTMIEKGKAVSAIQALKARQATDRIISATPVTDKVARNALYKWRNQFDNELSSQSGKLADASRTYRKAIVKDTILSPTRLNKSGEPSAFLPMLIGHGMMGKGIESGLGMLTGTSPAVWGAGATVGGSTARGLQKLGENPEVRQVLMGVLQKLMQKKNQSQ